MAGRIGREELALSNILFQILSLTFLLGVGLGVAAVTLMGRSIGEGRIERVEEIGWVAFKMGALIMSGIGLLFILFPGEVIGIFTSEDQLLQNGKPVILLLGIVQVFWAMGITLSHTLLGIGDAKGVMKIEVIIHWLIFLPLSYMLAFSLGYGLIGLWAGFSVYIVLLGLAMGWRFNKGLWKEIKV
jgi:Na+-driven multidrug efflux pump